MVEQKSSPNNVVKFSNNIKNIAEVHMIDAISFSCYNQLTASLSLWFFDYSKLTSEMALVFFDVCRFEITSFSYEIERIEDDENAKRVLPYLRGIYLYEQSDFLTETIAKHKIEYPDDVSSEFFHYLFFTDSSVVNLVACLPTKLVFNEDSIETKLNSSKDS